MPNLPLDIFSMTCTELAAQLKTRYGKGLFHARALYAEIFKKGNLALNALPAFDACPEILLDIRSTIAFPRGVIIREVNSGVRKLLINLHDGNAIESVIIPAKNRHTLCVSSQVGCKMGCTFCATGAQGFSRNLTVSEIVHQLFLAQFSCTTVIQNIVFMGMGEPLDNIDTVVKAIHVFSDTCGINIPPRNITVSTAGHAVGLARLAKEKIPNLRIAISLNAATNELRNQIMPLNRHYPLEHLKSVLLSYPLGHRGVFLIEYVILAGVNDSYEMAQALILWVRDLPVRINLIACNTTSSQQYQPPSREQCDLFKKWLTDAGLFVRVRQSMGSSIAAGCGQLSAQCTN